LFLHATASWFLQVVAGPLAPVVSVSCADTFRDILAGNGCGVYEPNANCKHMTNAKTHLLGFYIDPLIEHSFITTTCILHIEPAGNYQAQFNWHDGEWWLTLDPASSRTADTSSRKSISHLFAYHGLSYMMQPKF
jgi:hypothetical protein